ncbi:MAG: hypothetical protein RSC98_05055, partial [Clostridia bacterium]
KDKAILDLLYIENFNLAYDCKLLLRTLTIFFRRDSTEGFGDKHVKCPKMRVNAKPSPISVAQSAAAAQSASSKADEGEKPRDPLRAAL